MQWLKDILSKAKAWALKLWSEHKKTLIVVGLLMGGTVAMVHHAVLMQKVRALSDAVELPEVSCGLVVDEEADTD